MEGKYNQEEKSNEMTGIGQRSVDMENTPIAKLLLRLSPPSDVGAADTVNLQHC